MKFPGPERDIQLQRSNARLCTPRLEILHTTSPLQLCAGSPRTKKLFSCAAGDVVDILVGEAHLVTHHGFCWAITVDGRERQKKNRFGGHDGQRRNKIL